MRFLYIAIRVRLSLRRVDRSLDVTALVNSGYETAEPELLIPSSIARELGLIPNLPPAV